jgi:hypothetical protein
VTAIPAVKQPAFNLISLNTILEIGLACLVVAALLVGLIIFLIVRRRNRRGK